MAQLAFTLANEALKLLGNPRAFFSDAARQFGADQGKPPRDFVAECNALHRDLQSIPKFMWSEPFAALVAETTDQSPATFLKLWATARPPYEDCWIEWKTAVKGHKDEVTIGAWIRRNRARVLPMESSRGMYADDTGDEFEDYEVTVMIRLAKSAADRGAVPAERAEKTGILPVGLFVDFEHNYRLAPDEISDPKQIEWFWTREYRQRWGRRMAMVEHFGAHIGPVTFVPPFHVLPVLRSSPRREAIEQEGRFLVSMLVPELVCGLALMTTHLGGGGPIEYHAGHTKRQYYAGKFHKATEYQMVRLVRPMTAQQLIRRTLRNYTIERNLPLHPVIAAWHHRREAVDNCRVHPRACPLAEWSQLYDDEGESLGSQLQECMICGRRRWHQKGHTRGNAAFGVVHKDYEIVTHKNRRVIANAPDPTPPTR